MSDFWTKTSFRVEPLRLRHLFTHFKSLGGVQSILAHHHRFDGTIGLLSDFVSVFELPDPRTARFIGLGQSGWSTIQKARQHFTSHSTQDPSTYVYHNLWGTTIFADLDRSSRRIGILHSDWPTLDFELRSSAHLIDGLLCVSEPLINKVRLLLPEMDGKRLALLPYPIVHPVNWQPPQRIKPNTHSNILRVGFISRLVKAQKRVDRLPEVVACLDRLRIKFILEILGTGPEEQWLKKAFAPYPQVIIKGLLRGEDYWNTLSQWDCLLSVSDYEGLPISMLECMNQGVIPIFPKNKSGADAYVSTVSEQLLYPLDNPFDSNRIGAVMTWLSTRSVEERIELSTRAKMATHPHQPDHYFRVFTHFVRQMDSMPRRSSPNLTPRNSSFSDYLPFALLQRLCRRAFFRAPW